SMVLGYWDIRRMLLEFTDTSYEEKRYICGEAPDYDRSQWLDVKFKLDLDFPNLPYLMDGKNKITQSNAILRIRVDIMENQIMDFRQFSLFLGKKLTFVDFLTYDVLDQNRMFEPKCLDEFPNLKAFMCRCFKMPINNK
uniref:Glutathione S-transferase Mu 5 (Fragments) n=1 Tax=Mesocricetus auratus TaxID=10036 RepID=GSTM5_MESAU|nr:RecName: Full=Glutathione S-transferase Mu 5; AltName: Full=GST class-mu 5 [Mesocricetus auratus]